MAKPGVRIAATITTFAATADAGVGPLLNTTWGQSGAYQNATPTMAGSHTYPGCTTISSAQILYYYQYGTQGEGEAAYALDNKGLVHETITNDSLFLDFADHTYDFGAMATSMVVTSSATIGSGEANRVERVSS